MENKKKARKGNKSGKSSAASDNQSTVFGALKKVAVSDIDHVVGVERSVDKNLPEDKRFLDSIRATDGPRVPIALRKTEDEEYEIAYGHRRLDACRQLGIEDVFALVYEEGVSDQVILRDQVLENDERKSWKPFERAEAYKELLDEVGSQSKIAKSLGINRQEVNDILKILEIDPEVRESIDEHQQDVAAKGSKPLSLSHLVEIAKGDSPEIQVKLLEQAKSGKTSKGLRKGRDKKGKNSPIPKPPETGPAPSDDGSDGQLNLDTDTNIDETEFRIALGDHDELAREDITYPSPDDVMDCSRVAQGIMVWMDSCYQFGSKRKDTRLDWKGKKVKKGGLFVEYDGGDFYITLQGPEAEAHGQAAVIAACLAWELFDGYLKQGVRAA